MKLWTLDFRDDGTLERSKERACSGPEEHAKGLREVALAARDARESVTGLTGVAR